MKWEKAVGTNEARNQDLAFLAIIIFMLIGLLFKKAVAFIIIGLVAAYLIVNKWYSKALDKKLHLVNPDRTIKLFPGERAVFTFAFRNASIFPVPGGTFLFQAAPAITLENCLQEEGKYSNSYCLPATLIGKRKTVMELPVAAKQRGTSKINHIRFRFPHLFHFEWITLNYQPFYRTEFLVYPELLPVKGAIDMFHLFPGAAKSRFSPFEEIESPLGTRDYVLGDSFQRINWKASAKTDKLQTKVYENTLDMSYVFIVNLAAGKRAFGGQQQSERMEKLLSHTAYLCHIATKRRIPYAIFINARKPGKIPYFHLSEGGGKRHYASSLEMLARIPKQTMVIPFDHMLYRVQKGNVKRQTVIIIGDFPDSARQMMDSWGRQQAIFHVVLSEGEAFVKPVVKGGS